MKKLLALILALAMVFSLVACVAKQEAPAAKEEAPAEKEDHLPRGQRQGSEAPHRLRAAEPGL